MKRLLPLFAVFALLVGCAMTPTRLPKTIVVSKTIEFTFRAPLGRTTWRVTLDPGEYRYVGEDAVGFYFASATGKVSAVKDTEPRVMDKGGIGIERMSGRFCVWRDAGLSTEATYFIGAAVVHSEAGKPVYQNWGPVPKDQVSSISVVGQDQ